ncbi:MAG TPA: hypothetical protein VEA36_00205 [Candidatus Paceibacterota bacterium]|nr:hypothetical protein [Candidatus Paceibacterota bacterium]
MEIFLAKLLGLYFIIMGVMSLLRRKSIIPAIREFASNTGLRFVIAAIELVAGLAIVIAYPQVSVSLAGIISLVGYMMVIESLVYMAMPAKFVQHFIRSFNKPMWYHAGGALAIVAGIYLAGTAFGYF